MQGRGNFAPNYGQVPSTSMPLPYQQLPPPPPPPFQFQQGVSGSRPHLIQQGHGSFGCQPRGHGYGQGLPGGPMGYGGVLNLPLPPPPPLDLVRPPLQQSGGVPGFQQMLPPPPPPPPLGISTMVGGSVQSGSLNPHSASMVSLPPPPPLPSSTPPMPPCPPLSNFPAPGASKSSDHLSKDPETSNARSSEMCVSNSLQKLPDQNVVSHNTLFNGNGNGGKDGSVGKMDNLGRKEGQNLESQTSSSKQSEEKQGQSNIQSALVSKESTHPPDHLVIGSGSHSLVDSDMEMEDDITQPDGDLRFSDSLSGLYHTSDAVRSEHDVKGYLDTHQNSLECKKQDDAPSDDLKSPIAQGMKIGKNSGNLLKDGSPFRLLQGYASDDNSENDEHNSLKDIPEEASPSVTMDNLDCNRDTEKLVSESSQLMKAQETSADSKEDVKKVVTASVAPKARYDDVPDKYKNPLGSLDASYDSFHQKDAKVASADFAVPANNNLQKYIKKSAPAAPKVDEFGRLVREGASDSEPDDKSYNRRHGKRVRSRSRSGSPVDRRRRRSPRKRRERRSRSHSRSPRHRRSRSRSPTFRRADDFRRDKGRQDCFDFLKGRCYRGTSCRFMHHDPDKSERSRHHRGKQQHMEVPSRSKSSGRHENISNISKNVSHQEHDITKSQERRQSQDAKDDNYSLQVTHHAKISEQGGHWIESEIIKSESPKRIATEVNESQFVKAEPPAASTIISDTGDCKESTGTVDHGDKKLLQHMDNFSMPCTSSDQKSLSNKVSSEHAPNLMPHAQSPHGIVAPPLPKDGNLIPPPFSLPPQSAPMGNYPCTLLGQHSYVALPPTSWTSLPLPPPPPPPYGPPMDARAVTSTACSQIQSSNVPSRDNIGLQTCPMPYVTELSVYNTNSGYEQRPGIPIRDTNQSLFYGDGFKLRPPPLSNAGSQECGGNHLRSDFSGQLPVQGLTTSNSALVSMSDNMHFLPEQSKPLGEGINTSMAAHPHLQQQPRPYTSHYSAIDGVSSIPGSNNPSLSGYRPDLLTRSQPSYPLPDFGGFKTSAHYNPYASTFEQPLNSRFGTIFFPQESLSRAKPEGGDVGSSGSRQATPSPNGRKLPRSGGDQYDPLFDSIEPSANSVKKYDHAKNLEGANDSVRLSGSNKPLDVEENNKKKEVGAVATTASEDNEEFGETADAEVGMVENESLSSPVDAADMAAGEAEIDQVKSSTKSRKSKDSRSMKLFKVALANFVKDVLKPSWRQGNMSKEAFKTIVKKTVDKVSGAMKSHHIPKSQAKIDQYINSSQRKLTKLVMGYVDKYVKA